MTKRNVCRVAWMLVLAVLAGVWPGIAEDDDQTGRRRSTPDLSGVSSDERRMIESACRVEKMVEGPAAYNRCLASQLSALSEMPMTPDLSGVSPDERRMIESACRVEKMVEGPAAYNRCLASQLSALSEMPMTPDLSGVSPDERRMIESACRVEKMVEGPAAYNRCLASQLSALSEMPKTPDLSGVSPDERRMIESACRVEKMVEGPAAYNHCLASQVSALKDAPRIPDLSRLTSAADAAERTPNHSREVQSAQQRSKIKPIAKALSDDLQPSQSGSGSGVQMPEGDELKMEEFSRPLKQEREGPPPFGAMSLLGLFLIGGFIGLLYLGVRLILAVIRWIERH